MNLSRFAVILVIMSISTFKTVVILYSFLGALTTHTSLSPIRRGFVPGFVNYKKGCTRLAAASDIVYQLLAHGRWFSSGTPASSTPKTGRHDIAEILLKVVLSTINQIKSKVSIKLILKSILTIRLNWMFLELKNETQHFYNLNYYVLRSKKFEFHNPNLSNQNTV